MANVQLPKFETTFGDIDSANFKGLQDIVKGLLNSTIIMTEELTYLLNNLDTRNVNEIDGDILVAGTVTAAKMIVDKLSAITADLGKITAGEIYGNYIATRETGYPRAEMSNTDNMFKVASSSIRSISMDAWGGSSSSTPVQRFDSDNLTAVIYPLPNALAIVTVGGQGDIQINSGQDLYLSANYDILIPSFRKIRSQASGGNLQDYLEWLDARITALGG